MADGDGQIRTEVLTPDGPVFEGELFQISVHTTAGDIGVRSRHAPLLARLVPHELRMYESREEFDSGEGTRYAAAEGWIEVFADHVRVLADEAIDPGDLDSTELKERISEAEQRLSDAEPDSAEEDAAKREQARAEAFLGIAESGSKGQ